MCESRSAKTVSAWRTKRLDGPVELPREPYRGLLARGAHRHLELLAGRLGVALGLPGDHPLELLDLPPLDVRERRLDPGCRLGLAPFDLLAQRLLAPAEPLGDLLDHPAALARVRFELLERFGDRRLRRPLELLAQPQHRGTLLLGRGDELRRLGLDSRLGFGDQLLLPLLQLAHLRLQVLLRTVEIVRPGAEALVDAPRGRGERIGELFAGGALALAQLAAALVGHPPLLLGQARERVGTHPGEVRLQLVGAGRRLLGDDRLQRRLRLVERRVAPACAREEERGDCDQQAEDRQRQCNPFGHGLIVVPAYPAPMALAEELERIAELTGATAVLAAEAQPGERVYLCAFESDASVRTWLAVGDDGEPISERRRVRDAVAILALCELAEETAAGGDLDELRSQLAALRVTENPEGIDDAEQAALELQHVLGAPPVLATPARLDEIGAATRRLEIALGGAVQGSPFAAAMKGASEVVEASAARGRGRVPRRPRVGVVQLALPAWKAAALVSRSAATPRSSCAGSRSSRRSRPSRCRRRSGSSSRR